MKEESRKTRRGFLQVATGAALLAGPAFAQQKPVPPLQKKITPVKPPPDEKEEEVSPPEDLMREHGLLNRVLLVYEEIDRRLGTGAEFDPSTLTDAATIIKNFIENYHEKLEEEHLFPRFRKAGKLVQMVDTLQAQHAAGRQITEFLVLKRSRADLKGDAGKQVSRRIHQFIRMYRPHEAREDTVLFPALRSLVSEHEFAAMGEDFEKKEHELFGKEGFEGETDHVAEIESLLGIDD